VFFCSLKRLRRNVAAEVRAVEIDFLHGGVGGGWPDNGGWLEKDCRISWGAVV